MSSRESQGTTIPWASPFVYGTFDVGRTHAFRLLNIITAMTLVTAFVLVCTPYEGLLLAKGIETININLNEPRISHLVHLKYKNLTNSGMALYFQALTSNYSIGDITMGDMTVKASSHCVSRAVAAYNESKTFQTPKFVNVFDFFPGAIRNSRYVRSEKGNEYFNYDSSVYLMPVPTQIEPVVKASIKDLLYTDIEYVYRASFIGAGGKIIHEVKFFHAAIIEEIKVGDEVLIPRTEKGGVTIMVVEVPQHKVMKMVITPNSSVNVAVEKEYYVDTENWDKIYINASGLERLIRLKNIPSASVPHLFVLTRINLPARVSVNYVNKVEDNPLLNTFSADVGSLTYTIIAADMNYIIGQIAQNKNFIAADTAAVERVIMGWRQVNVVEYDHLYVCTKNDLTYDCRQLL